MATEPKPKKLTSAQRLDKLEKDNAELKQQMEIQIQQLAGMNSSFMELKGLVDIRAQRFIEEVQGIIAWHEHGGKGSMFWTNVPEEIVEQQRKHREAEIIARYQKEQAEAQQAEKNDGK